jgi:DNA-binding PadR family transcriptional regulator
LGLSNQPRHHAVLFILEVRAKDGRSIYVALQRMAERGYVAGRKTRAVSADGREREIGLYVITGAGQCAVDQFAREAAAVRSLNPAFGAQP